MTKLRLFIILTGLLCASQTICAQESSEIVNCLYKAYQPQIEFYDTLHKLEKELLDQGVIQDTLGLDYQMLVERFNEDSNSFDLEKVKVDQYLNPEPFKDCINNAQSPGDLDHTYRYMFLMAIYLDLARQNAEVSLLIDDNQVIWLNGKKVTLDNLESKLSSTRQRLLETGVPDEAITLGMKVSPETKMRLEVDIQTLLRKVNFRKIIYYSYE